MKRKPEMQNLKKTIKQITKTYQRKTKPIIIEVTDTFVHAYGKNPRPLIYVRFNNHKIKKREGVYKDEVFIDFDSKRKIIGIKII